MSKTFTLDEVRTIIHKEIAGFLSLKDLPKNQTTHRQVLIKYGTDVLLKLESEFENTESI